MRNETNLEKRMTIAIGHAKRKGATKEELEILVKAFDIIRKYGPIKNVEKN